MSLLLRFLDTPPADPDLPLSVEAAPLEDIDLITLEAILSGEWESGPFDFIADVPQELLADDADLEPILEGHTDPSPEHDDYPPDQALDPYPDAPQVDPTADVADLLLDTDLDLIFPLLDEPAEEEPFTALGHFDLHLVDDPPPPDPNFLIYSLEAIPFILDQPGEDLVEPTQFVDPPPPPIRSKGKVIRVIPQRGRFEIRISR